MAQSQVMFDLGQQRGQGDAGNEVNEENSRQQHKRCQVGEKCLLGLGTAAMVTGGVWAVFHSQISHSGHRFPI